MPPIQIGDRLPDIELERTDGKRLLLTANERAAHALLFVRDGLLEAARAYIESWEHRLADLRVWAAEVLVVSENKAIESSVPSALAAEEVWATLGIAPGAGALIIADRWGAVYFARETTRFDNLPDVAEVEDWLRYLATQCPECGVVDEPGYGEWAP